MAVRNEVTIILLTLAVSTAGICYWQWRRRRKVFVKVGTVKKLYHFPIKSLAAVEVPELECMTYGAVCCGLLDRTFILTKTDGVLISQREEPSLVLLKAEVVGDCVVVTGDGKEPLKLPIREGVSPDDEIVMVNVHSDKIPAVDCGKEAAEWFQDYLKRSDVRLLRYSHELPKRQFESDNALLTKVKSSLPVYLQDMGPFHVVCESSLNELNTRTEVKVSALNFRPNILIEGSKPFDEDNWKYISFSSGVEMANVVPCSRCVLTTNDPETGIKTNKEPLVALRKFRVLKDPKWAKVLRYSPCFGMICSLVKPGPVKVGDEVFAVISKGFFSF